jgi:hypothetical protein
MPPTLSEAQQKELELARARFRGKTLVMHGGAWTAEAREPQRRTAVMEQLELAHKLRKQLEEAATKAESADMSVSDIQELILEQHVAMNQLASLTDSAKNGYVLHSYDEYNNWTKLESDRLEKGETMAAETLKNQVERIRFPAIKWPSRIDVEPADPEEPRKMAVDIQEEKFEEEEEETPRNSVFSAVARMPTDSGDEEPAAQDKPGPFALKAPPAPVARQEKPNLNIRGHVLAMQERMQIARDQSRTKRRREAGAENRKKRSRVEKPRIERALSARGDIARMRVSNSAVDQKSKRKSLPSKLREETGVIVRPPATTPNRARDHVRPENVASMLPLPMNRTTPSKRRTGAKKCHNCKKMQSSYLKCRFVMPTGCRCGKTYCMGCLAKDYEGLSDPADVEEYQYVIDSNAVVAVSQHSNMSFSL